ncbi:MAG: CxxxxCH/CxxCH domain-containing protein [Proteobacteria bacterium]|nr:CxxxxCH/CxxCH domain-containing protein [Pseudomonadota bacterium]MBU4354608.1 CxxxxCH/CxxCH domain-containing protein [Pseudomonadota bacterium]
MERYKNNNRISCLNSRCHGKSRAFSVPGPDWPGPRDTAVRCGPGSGCKESRS